MSRIHDRFANCVVYIYDNLANAKRGERTGGSGFLAGIAFEDNPGRGEVYVVTNRHVINKTQTPAVRINRNDGTTEFFETTKDEWVVHPNGDDIAAIAFRSVAWDDLNIRPVLLAEFLMPALVRKQDVGIGDDVFMIGRFINHEGKQKNLPSIRFGNIAMMPTKAGLDEGEEDQEDFLVDIRSLPGYTGSPVFLYSVTTTLAFSRRHLEEEAEALRNESRERTGIEDPVLDSGSSPHIRTKGAYLLGIDWCHLHAIEKVRHRNGRPHPEGWTVETNSGMAGVIPCWKIAELLNCEDLTKMRKAQDGETSKMEKKCV